VKASYNEISSFPPQVKDEVTALKSKAAGQKEAVETLTDKITAALAI